MASSASTEHGIFREAAKRLVLECSEQVRVPTSYEVDYLAYLVRSSHGGSGGGASSSVLSVMGELLKEAFTNCLSQVKSEGSHTSPGGHTSPKHFGHASPEQRSPWSCITCIHGYDTPPPLFISFISNLCRHASVVPRVSMGIMELLKMDHTSVMSGLAEVWCVYLKGLTEQCAMLWSSCDLHGLLVRLALCLLVREVVGVVSGHSTADMMQVAESGDSRSETSVGGCVAVQEWICTESLKPLLANIQEGFSGVIYKCYCEYEELEKKGKRQNLGVSREGVALLKSVDLLSCSVQLTCSIAEGCADHKLLRASVEFALRLATRSLKHLLQLCERVGKDLPVQWLYLVLVSLDDLHSVLLQLHVPQDMEMVHAEVCVQLQESVQQVGVAVMEYHTSICVTCLLQDASSSSWIGNNPFYEGKRCSWSVQMWACHMRALCYDLCTHLPDRLGQLREGVLCGVLSSCLSHLVARYSSIAPPPTHLSHFIADVIFILSCVNALLPWLEGGVSEATPSVSMGAIHYSCGLLFGVAVVLASSLQQLINATSQLQHTDNPKAREVGAWQLWLEEHGHLLACGQSCATPPPAVKKALSSPGSLSSQEWGAVLQVVLAEGACLSVELCTGSSRASWSQEALDVLQLLSYCPHVQWALAAVVWSVQLRPRHRRDNSLEAPGKVDGTDPVSTILQHTLGPVLMSYLMKKGMSSLDSCSDMNNEWAWSEELLEGLEDVLQREVARPVLALLHCMACAGQQAGEVQHVGNAVAKILADILMKFSSMTVPHLFHAPSTSRHLYHVFQLLCVALDPDAQPAHVSSSKPEGASSSQLPASTVQQVCQTHASIWRAGRAELGQLVDMSPTSRPLTLLEEELEDCTLEEHCLAAQLISANEEGQASLQKVCMTLREHFGVRQVTPFNPLEEYCNVGVTGSGCAVDQDKLANCGEHLHGQGTIQGCLHWLHTSGGPPLDVLIRKWRWEWQEIHSEDIQPEDRELASELADKLKTICQ